MTKLEYIRNCTKEQLVRLLCDVANACETCTAQELCRNGHNGFLDWLEEDVDE